jgi:CDP-paratose 2-epimerase
MTTLITGGAGFVGANLADRLLSGGEAVRILDNMSRAGVEANATWLAETHPDGLELVVEDVRDFDAVRRAMRGVDHVFHLAAQVAVTSSLSDPRADFGVNALGTLNVLEAVRAQDDPPSLVFTSTNKVYGGLEDIALCSARRRYEPVDPEVAAFGISEKRPLSFHSPYGCSKGTADQYVLDYARTFGIRAVVLRMSCIYGPHQFGNEDQGWVAHFLLRALRGEPITLYGDGKQVRDVLFVDDLVDAFLRVRTGVARLAGRAFNVGGGPTRTTSLLELVDRIERLTRRRPVLACEPWRRADQRYYVSDTRALAEATAWCASTTVDVGVERLVDWLQRQGSARPRTDVTAGAQP